ncbi:MAG: aldo/keto reductase [Bryobacteraceae bacterium]|nr:aldo/keto reductase [Bryobacteraceae bacterium]
MDRRAFLHTTFPTAGAALGVSASSAAAATDMPMGTLGKTGLKVSRFCLGGAHMRMKGEENAIKMIHRSLDLGVNFFDSAAKYHNGESDVTYGKALAGKRQQVLLMSKAENRTKDGAMAQLENTLKRMKTDYLDLWQCHEVVRHDEVDKIFGPGGSLEAFVLAKKQGKVRHIGFTGHGDPSVHLRLLEGFEGWETVQCPINLIDPHYLSFTYNVLPRVKQKGLGMLAMKSNAMGGIGKNNIAPIEECLRFTLSQEPDTVVSGPQTIAELEQNIGIVKAWQKFTPQEISSILDRTRKGMIGSKVETYKKKEPWLTAASHREHRDGDAD